MALFVFGARSLVSRFPGAPNLVLTKRLAYHCLFVQFL